MSHWNVFTHFSKHSSAFFHPTFHPALEFFCAWTCVCVLFNVFSSHTLTCFWWMICEWIRHITEKKKQQNEIKQICVCVQWEKVEKKRNFAVVSPSLYVNMTVSLLRLVSLFSLILLFSSLLLCSSLSSRLICSHQNHAFKSNVQQ